MDTNNIMEQLSNIIGNMNNNQNDNINPNGNQNNTNNNDFNIDIDLDMILKAKEIADSMKTPDPRSILLQSLKPYLKNEKKEKIDQYIKFLSLTKIIDTIGPNFMGSDKNDK